MPRCKAISVTTGKVCKRDARKGCDTCATHAQPPKVEATVTEQENSNVDECECPVCYESMGADTALKCIVPVCDHALCIRCTLKVFDKVNPTCPMCRRLYTMAEINYIAEEIDRAISQAHKPYIEAFVSSIKNEPVLMENVDMLTNYIISVATSLPAAGADKTMVAYMPGHKLFTPDKKFKYYMHYTHYAQCM